MNWAILLIWGFIFVTDSLVTTGNFGPEFFLMYFIKPSYYYLNRLKLRLIVLEWRQWQFYIILILGITFSIIFILPEYAQITKELPNSTQYYLYHTIVILFLLIMSSARTIVPDWYNGYLVTKQLEEKNFEQQIEILKKEYAVTRTLINPHTLANELTYIQSMVSKQNENSIVAISLLSEMMRSYLSAENRGFITVEKEIQNINFYLKYRTTISSLPLIRCQVKNLNKEDLGRFLPALWFLPIVENIFKHGSVTSANIPEIIIKNNFGIIIFKTTNQLKPFQNIKHTLDGFGLKSVKEAGELYFEYSELTITQQDSKFITELKFKLND